MTETCQNMPRNRFMYFVVLGNHAPLLALGTDRRPLVVLYVGSSGTVFQRSLESPARCAGLEPATQNNVSGNLDEIIARIARQPALGPANS